MKDLVSFQYPSLVAKACASSKCANTKNIKLTHDRGTYETAPRSSSPSRVCLRSSQL